MQDTSSTTRKLTWKTARTWAELSQLTTRQLVLKRNYVARQLAQLA